MLESEYVVSATGAKVTITNAKSLLLYYCSSLPSDRYTACGPPHPCNQERCSRAEPRVVLIQGARAQFLYGQAPRGAECLSWRRCTRAQR
jgi:hypothetical protein